MHSYIVSPQLAGAGAGAGAYGCHALSGCRRSRACHPPCRRQRSRASGGIVAPTAKLAPRSRYCCRCGSLQIRAQAGEPDGTGTRARSCVDGPIRTPEAHGLQPRRAEAHDAVGGSARLHVRHGLASRWMVALEECCPTTQRSIHRWLVSDVVMLRRRWLHQRVSHVRASRLANTARGASELSTMHEPSRS